MSDDDDNDRRNRSPDSRGYGDNDRREPQDRDRDRDRGDRSDPKHNDSNNNNNNGSRSNNGRDAAGGRGGDDAVIGSTSLRPVFLGNLDLDYRSEEVVAIFEKPVEPPNASMRYSPIPVDRIDLKRGYCFVFLKDVSTQSEKEQAERFVQDINGMYVTRNNFV
jgi:RNA recognition motif-containing protein